MQDRHGFEGFGSIFGDAQVAPRVPSVLEQFQTGVSEYSTVATTTGTGSVAGDNGSAVVSLSGTGAGFARLRSRRPLRYVSGHDSYLYGTFGCHGVGPGIRQSAGLFDAEGGFRFGFDEGVFELAYIRDGVVVSGQTRTAPALAKIEANPRAEWIFLLRYGYLGVAPIVLYANSGIGSMWEVVAYISLTGTLEDPHTSQPAQYVAMEIERSSGTGDASMRSGSWSAGTIGPPGKNPSDRPFASRTSKSISTALAPLLTLRNKATFLGAENKIGVQVVSLSFSNDDTKAADILIYRGATLAGAPSWTSIDENNSVVEYDTAATGLSGGYLQGGWPVGSASSAQVSTEELQIFAFPGETITVAAQGQGPSVPIRVVVNHVEFF